MKLSDEEILELIGPLPSFSSGMIKDTDNALEVVGLKPLPHNPMERLPAWRFVINQAYELPLDQLITTIVMTEMLFGRKKIYHTLKRVHTLRTSHVPESNANDPTAVQAPDPIG